MGFIVGSFYIRELALEGDEPGPFYLTYKLVFMTIMWGPYLVVVFLTGRNQ